MTPPMKPAVPPWWAYACLAAAMALVGSYVALSKLLVAVFPIFLLAWLRFGIAALAMARWVRRDPGEPRLLQRERRLLFLESFFGNFLFSICMLFGVARTTALAAGVILASIPAVVAVMSWLMLGERIAPAASAVVRATPNSMQIENRKLPKKDSRNSRRRSRGDRRGSTGSRRTQRDMATAAMPKRSQASRKIGNTATSSLDSAT